MRSPLPRQLAGLACATLAGLLVVATPASATATDVGPVIPLLSSQIDVGASSAFGQVTSAGVGELLDSSFALDDLDPVTGALLGSDVSTALSADYAVAADLSDSSLLALNTAELARQAQEKADAARKAQAGTSDVGPDGCPTSAPENTLREGALNVGVLQLCTDSVKAAPTAAAARAVKYALSELGQPYSQPRRMDDGYYDCSSFVTRAYTAGGLNLIGPSGWAPTTTTIRSASWATHISLADALPGDMVFPFADHVAMVLADGYMVHTNRNGDVSHVKKLYTSAYWVVRVDPSKV